MKKSSIFVELFGILLRERPTHIEMGVLWQLKTQWAPQAMSNEEQGSPIKIVRERSGKVWSKEELIELNNKRKEEIRGALAAFMQRPRQFSIVLDAMSNEEFAFQVSDPQQVKHLCELLMEYMA